MATPKRKNSGGGGGGGNTPKKKPPAPVDPAAAFNMLGPATRDVRLTIHPQIEALNRLRLRALADYRQQAQRSNSMFGQELGALAPLAGQFGTQSDAILGNLQGALQAFGGGSSGGIGAENAAASTASDAGARGFLGVLGSGQQADLAGLQAARAGASMQQQEMGTNIAGQRQDALDQLMSQKQDVFGQMPAMIQSREDALQQQAFERNLAQSQFNLNRRSTLADISNNKALQDFMRQNLQALLGGGSGGFGGPGFPGQGGNTGPNAPGSGGNQGGTPHGRGNLPPPTTPDPQQSALQAFVTGNRPWAQVQQQGRGNIRQGIQNYYTGHEQDPAFADLQRQHPGWVPYPNAIIQAIRNFYYGPHGPGQKPLP